MQGRCAAVVATAVLPLNTCLLAGLLRNRAAHHSAWLASVMEKEKGQLTLFDCRKVRA